MKRVLTLAAILSASFSFGQQFSLLPSPENSIMLNHEVVKTTVAHTLINGQPYQDFSKSFAVTLQEVGAPALPYFAESVIVPNQGKVTLTVDHDGYTDHQNVEVAPSKGHLKRNVNPSEIAYTFGAEYNTNAFYPASLAQMGEAFNLRNTRGVTVMVSPYQYNPVTKTLRIYENVRPTLVINENEAGVNELDVRASQDDVFSQIYHDQFLNADLIFGRYTPVEEDGDMLIIAGDDLIDEIEPLAQWKTETGIKTTIVGTSTSGSSASAIKSYIDNFYASNPNLVYILLVGDHADIACYTYGTSGWGEELWSDSYFGMLTGSDFYPEAFVGRFSGNAAQISTMVQRTMEYEKQPASGDWMTRAIGLASDEGAGIGDDGEPDWQHNRNMRTKLMGYGYTEVHEFYDGSHGGADASGNPSPAIISPAVNDGVGLFNYTGHGDQNTCITGNYDSGDINASVNNGKYPFVISVACNNGTFTSGTCISETWTRATNQGSPTGAISACGSSILMAWAEPMQTQDEMTELIAETYTGNRKSSLGGIFYNASMSTLEDYNSSSTAKEVMQTWIMFGDPSTVFRNKATTNMVVTHWQNVPLGTTTVDVNCDVDGAKVALVQDGIILGIEIAAGGMVTFTFPALTSIQPLIVTGTKQNYMPYQGDITVENGPNALAETDVMDAVSVYPNPATDVVNVQWTDANPISIELRDLSGKLIYTANTSDVTGSAIAIPTNTFAAGVYVLQYKTQQQVGTTKLVIR
jgi:gingipain R